MIEAGILTAIDARVAAALTARPRPVLPLLVDGWPFGFVDPARKSRLEAFPGVFEPAGDGLALARALATPATRTAALDRVARILADEGALTAWRDERYAVCAAFEDPAAFLLERAAARYLGVRTYAAHANGLVADETGAHRVSRMWLARRSPSKPIDPSQLDNLVGGGITAGEAPGATLVREAWEEAGIPAALAVHARACGTIDIDRAVSDGYQRETIFTYDLPLPPEFVPANQDGEVTEYRLVDLGVAARLLANVDGPNVVTLDATCVARACLRRHAASSP